jgi:hypothetical protein
MEWDGIERRKNAMNGEQIVKEIDIRLVTLETKFEDGRKFHDEQANERQKITCHKLDDIKANISTLQNNFVSLDKATILATASVNERITKLPCEKRAGLYNQVKIMWGVLLLVIAAIVGEWVKKK